MWDVLSSPFNEPLVLSDGTRGENSSQIAVGEKDLLKCYIQGRLTLWLGRVCVCVHACASPSVCLLLCGRIKFKTAQDLWGRVIHHFITATADKESSEREEGWRSTREREQYTPYLGISLRAASLVPSVLAGLCMPEWRVKKEVHNRKLHSLQNNPGLSSDIWCAGKYQKAKAPYELGRDENPIPHRWDHREVPEHGPAQLTSQPTPCVDSRLFPYHWSSSRRARVWGAGRTLPSPGWAMPPSS